MRKVLTLISVLFCCMFFMSGSFVRADVLEELFPGEDWIVLARPNSAWKPGVIIDLRRRDDPSKIGDFNKCLPKHLRKYKESTHPKINIKGNFQWRFGVKSSGWYYSLYSFFAGYIRSDINYISIKSSKELIIYDQVSIISWLKEDVDGETNFDKLGLNCKLILRNGDLAIVGQVFYVTDGLFGAISKSQFSKKFGGSFPRAIKADFTSELRSASSFSQIVSPDRPPIAIAVRLSRLKDLWTEGVEKFGAFPVGSGAQNENLPTLREAMDALGLSANSQRR